MSVFNQTLKKKMCRVSAKRLSIYNFAWEHLKAICRLNPKQKKSKKNCVSYIKSEKGPKICPDGICRPDPKS
jgi:hypothetical protein